MIANITQGNSFTGLIMYNEKKVKAGNAERLSSKDLSIYGPNKSVISWLENTAALNPRVENKTFHASLSLSDADHLNKYELSDLADDYMNKLGYSNTPYMVYRHCDTGHDHIHIVASRVDNNGRKIKDTYERYRSQEIARELEVKYKLQVVSSFKDKKENQLETVSLNIKQTLQNKIEHVLHTDKASNFEDYKLLLKGKGVILKTLHLDKDGNNLPIPGIYYALGKTLHPESKLLKGSSFYKNYSYAKLQTIFNTNLIIKQTKPAIVPIRTIQQLQLLVPDLLIKIAGLTDNSQDGITNLLKDYKLVPEFITNSSGVSGWRIKDILSNITYKASEIDRKLSWNAIALLLSGSEELSAAPVKKAVAPLLIEPTYQESYFPIIFFKPIGPELKAWKKSLFSVVDLVERMGFVTQEQLEQQMKTKGFIVNYTRMFSETGKEIHSLSYTEIASGKTVKQADLKSNRLSWGHLKSFIQSDQKDKTFEQYVKSVAQAFNNIPQNSITGKRIDTFMAFINAYGFTLVNDNQVFALKQMGTEAKTLLSTVTGGKNFYDYFNLARNTLSPKNTLLINSKGAVLNPLNFAEKELLKALIIQDPTRITLLLSKGIRIPKLILNNPELISHGKDIYTDILSIQAKIANTLKFVLYVQAESSFFAPKQNIDLYIKSLNKRGIGVELILVDNKLSDIKYFDKNTADTFLCNQTLPPTLGIAKLDKYLDLTVNDQFKTRLEQTKGFAISCTDQQIELFNAIEQGNENLEMKLVFQRVRADLSADEEEYFGLDDASVQTILENNHKDSVLDDFIYWIESLSHISTENPMNHGDERVQATRRVRRPR